VVKKGGSDGAAFFVAKIEDAKRYNFISGKTAPLISYTFMPCK
jgi:hypothetical protein